jgi:hypothetical protein
MRRAWLVLVLVAAAGSASSPAVATPLVSYECVGGPAGARAMVVETGAGSPVRLRRPLARLSALL